MPSHSSQSISKTSCRVRIRRATWEPTLRRLLAHGEMYAVGAVRRHGIAGELLLLVDDLQVPVKVPDGRNRPPLDDWCTIVVDPDGSLSIPQVVRVLQPKSSHLVVVLILDRPVPNRCRMFVYDAGSIVPLDSCEIIGAGMLRLESTPSIEQLRNVIRSSRTRGALGETLHDRLRRSTVMVVGLGRIGSQLCFQLASLGVGRLRLLDPDFMASENLDGMPELTVADIGLSKAEAVASRLLAFRPGLSITYLEQSMTTLAATTLLHRPCDLYVTAVDNDVPRLGISLLANRTLTPHLDVGTLVRRDEQEGRSLFADIRLLLPGMCVACIGGLADPDATLYQLAAPDDSLQRGTRTEWSTERSGSLNHLNAIACGIAVELWLRLLQGEVGAYWQRVTWEARSPLQLAGSPIEGDETCPYCRPA